MILHSCDDGLNSKGTVLLSNFLNQEKHGQVVSVFPNENKSGNGGGISFPLEPMDCLQEISPRNFVYDTTFFLDGIRALLFSKPTLASEIKGAIFGINSGLNEKRDIIHSANINAGIYLCEKYQIPTLIISSDPAVLATSEISKLFKIVQDEVKVFDDLIDKNKPPCVRSCNVYPESFESYEVKIICDRN